MKFFMITFGFLSGLFQLNGKVEESILPPMETVYTYDFGKKINSKQKEQMQAAAKHQHQKLRVMTYNMLYNAKDAEEQLPKKYRWDKRKPRLIEYLIFSKADIIGSQELQEDQVQEIMQELDKTYAYYGLKTRENEGRTDINAIFYNPKRVELLDAKTIPYQDVTGQNAFTYCYFKDKVLDKKFVVLNTKLTWSDANKRLAEALQLSEFVKNLPPQEGIILLGDFNTFPFIEHKKNLFYDGDFIIKVLTQYNLKNAQHESVFGHYGPLCSITNSKTNLAPFAGPEFPGFILDHIFVNDQVQVFTHGIDPAKVEGEYPSDHFPMVADIFI